MPTPIRSRRLYRLLRRGLVPAVVGIVLLAGCGAGKTAKAIDAAADGGATTTIANGDSSSTTGAPGAPGATGTTAKGGPGATKPGGPAGGGTTVAKAPTTTLKPTASAADVATARGYLLTASDVGAGYEKKTSNEDGQIDSEKCGKGNPVFAKNNPNDVRGDTFTKAGAQGFADSVGVGSNTTIAATVAQATDAMNIVKSDEFLRCIEQQVKEQSASKAPPGSTFDVKASRRPLTGADDATDIHLVVTVTYGVNKITGDVDVFTYRKAKFLALAIVTLFGPSNAGEPARIAEVMKNKIR